MEREGGVESGEGGVEGGCVRGLDQIGIVT